MYLSKHCQPFSIAFLIAALAASAVRGQENVIDARNTGNCIWDGKHDVSSAIQTAINTARKARGWFICRLAHGRSIGL
jgi:hypothetical protein